MSDETPTTQHRSGEWDASEECRSGLRRLERAVRDVTEKLDTIMEKRSTQATELAVVTLRVTTLESQLKEQSESRRQIGVGVMSTSIGAAVIGIASLSLHYLDRPADGYRNRMEPLAPTTAPVKDHP